jgi:thiamine-phosphate pyrophosphorylase
MQVQALLSRARMPMPGRLYLLFTPQLCRSDPTATLQAAIDGGVDVVQWRSKRPDRLRFEACRRRCRDAGVPLVVNDDVMLAVRSGVDGAHVGQEDLPAPAARKLLVGQWLGISTHDVGQIEVAARDGADYIGFGPCHPTATKGYAEGQSTAAISAAVAAADRLRLPLFAIGGITAENLLPLRRLGVDRIAVSRCILQADDPKATAQALRTLL